MGWRRGRAALLPMAMAMLAVGLLGSGAAAAETGQHWQATHLDTQEKLDASTASCTVLKSNCEACAFHDDGSYDCSTPGFACLPTSWTCMTLVAGGSEDAAQPQ